MESAESSVKAAQGAARRSLAALLHMDKQRTESSGPSHLVEISDDKQVVEQQSGSAAAEEAEVAASMRSKVIASCGSWVLKMEDMLEGVDQSVELDRWERQVIHRVPEYIRRITVSLDAYQPQMVSIGPMHHGERHLLPMEQHKRRAALHLVKLSNKPLWQIVAAVEEVADEVLAAYSELDEYWRANKPRFVEMLFIDGCFLLELMQISMVLEDDEAVYAAANDPIFSAEMFMKLWPLLRNDMVCLENQIPMIVLQKLHLTINRGTSAVQSSKLEVNLMVHHVLNVPVVGKANEDMGVHILDILHRSFCGRCKNWQYSDAGYDASVPCASELFEAGISFEKGKPKCIDIDFDNGILTVPLMETMDDNTEIILLNLLAYEWVHPGSKRYVSSYVSFMDKLIQSEKDMALLRSEGICNNTGSDKKTVEMIKTISALSWYPQIGSRLGHVNWKINSYYRRRSNTWRAIFMKTYLAHPWAFISLVVAVIYLVESILQTIYTILPFYTHED